MQAITRKGPLLHSVLIVPTPSADRQRKPRQACGWRTHPAGPWSGGPGFPSRLHPFAWGSAPHRRGLCVESLCHISRLRPATRGHALAEGYSQKPHPGKKAKGTGNRPGRIRQETAEPQAPGARSKKERAGVSTWRQGEVRAGAGPGPRTGAPRGLVWGSQIKYRTPGSI